MQNFCSLKFRLGENAKQLLNRLSQQYPLQLRLHSLNSRRCRGIQYAD